MAAPTSTRRAGKGKTPEERAAEIDTLTAQLNDAVPTLTTPAAWLAMLRVTARFTSYSPTNCLLLWMQAEQRGVTVTRVAGYRAWQAMGRQVVKGARSFAVLAPVPAVCRPRRPRSGPRPVSGLPTARTDARPWSCAGSSWSGCSATKTPEGEPLREALTPGYLTGDTPDGGWAALTTLVEQHGYSLTTTAEPGDTRGHTDYTSMIVNVDPGCPLAEQLHILVHELGHIRCGHQERWEVSRAQRETEAESVALVVCTVLGLELGDVAAVYVGGWTDGDVETITAAQAANHQAARTLLADLEDQPADDLAKEN